MLLVSLKLSRVSLILIGQPWREKHHPVGELDPCTGRGAACMGVLSAWLHVHWLVPRGSPAPSTG